MLIDFRRCGSRAGPLCYKGIASQSTGCSLWRLTNWSQETLCTWITYTINCIYVSTWHAAGLYLRSSWRLFSFTIGRRADCAKGRDLGGNIHTLKSSMKLQDWEFSLRCDLGPREPPTDFNTSLSEKKGTPICLCWSKFPPFNCCRLAICGK